MRVFEIMKVGSMTISNDNFGTVKNLPRNSTTGKLPGDNDFHYSINSKKNETTIYIFIPSTSGKSGPILGKLEVSPVPFPLKDARTVDMISVHPNYRGQGIAKSLYGVYFTVLGGPLVSGGGQTPGGRRNWLSMANIPGVILKGWVSVDDDLFDTDGEVFGRSGLTIDTMTTKIMESGGEYMGEVNNRHFFSFEVVPGQNQLEPVAKRALDAYRSYGIGYGTGLYAIWTGK